MSDGSDTGTDGEGGPAEPVDENDPGRPTDDPERAAMLRDVAREVRGDSDEAERVAAVLFRVSDLYDPAEETDPESIYRNMRNILRVSERGTLERDRDGE